jgi:hypothetical protein
MWYFPYHKYCDMENRHMWYFPYHKFCDMENRGMWYFPYHKFCDPENFIFKCLSGMSLISLIDVLSVVLYTYCLTPDGRRLTHCLTPDGRRLTHCLIPGGRRLICRLTFRLIPRGRRFSSLDVYIMIHISTFLKLRRPSLFFLGQSFAEMVYTQGGLKFGTVGRHALVQWNTLFQVCLPTPSNFACSVHTVRSSAPNEAHPTTTCCHSTFP